jgi:ATP-dependent Clp protease ATP-binding subunit ClpB
LFPSYYLVFDEGRLTDGKGKTINCKDAIFIMTSNLAQQEIAEEAEALREESRKRGVFGVTNGEHNCDTSLSSKFVNSVIYPILRDHFKRDEFLGRINEILFFLPFNDYELKEIVSKELDIWKDIAAKKHGMRLTWSDVVVDLLKQGYNLRYGARSIKHEVERKPILE